MILRLHPSPLALVAYDDLLARQPQLVATRQGDLITTTPCDALVIRLALGAFIMGAITVERIAA